MRKYAIDTKLLPKVWLTWASTKNRQFNKRYWLNCQTGQKKDKPESWMRYRNENDAGNSWYNGRDKDDKTVPFGIYYEHSHDKIWFNSGTNVRFAYAKYHKDIDRLELMGVTLDTSRKEEAREWKCMGGHYFIGKDKSVIDADGNVCTRFSTPEGYWNVYKMKNYIQLLLRLHVTKSFVEEFRKFIGADYFTIGNGNTVTIEHPWHLQKWYDTVQKCKSAGKQHQLVAVLAELPLTDEHELATKYSFKNVKYEHGGYYYNSHTIACFERVNDEWSVIREFRRRNDDVYSEIQRVYIDEKNTVRIASPTKDGWIPARTVNSSWSGYRPIFVNLEEATEKCKRIKYITSAINNLNVDKYDVFNTILVSMRFPDVEQLIKLGHYNITTRIINSYTPMADLKDMFGVYNKNESNILRKIGLTKFQLDTIVEQNEGRYFDTSLVKRMRMMLGDNLTAIDNETFKKYAKACKQLNRYWWHDSDYRMRSMNIDQTKFFKNIVRIGERHDTIYNVVNDLINSYDRLEYGTRPVVNWYFDDYSEAVRVHDAVVELKRVQDEARQALYNMEAAERRKREEEKRKKIDKERKVYEYEDDNYIIRLPKSVAEIVEEGSTQRICIGGYTARHSEGNTNLFFLRKKDAENVPFYAIEMNNNKSIVQIHGFANKWLGNDPDAIPTVIRWLRKHGITCDDKILTCKSSGYGATRDYVPMPVVD